MQQRIVECVPFAKVILFRDTYLGNTCGVFERYNATTNVLAKQKTR